MDRDKMSNLYKGLSIDRITCKKPVFVCTKKCIRNMMTSKNLVDIRGQANILIHTRTEKKLIYKRIYMTKDLSQNQSEKKR